MLRQARPASRLRVTDRREAFSFHEVNLGVGRMLRGASPRALLRKHPRSVEREQGRLPLLRKHPRVNVLEQAADDKVACLSCASTRGSVERNGGE